MPKQYEVSEHKDNETISLRNFDSEKDANDFADLLNEKTKSNRYKVLHKSNPLKTHKKSSIDIEADYEDKETRRYAGAWAEINWQAKDAVNKISTQFGGNPEAMRSEMYEETRYNIEMIEQMIGRLQYPSSMNIMDIAKKERERMGTMNIDKLVKIADKLDEMGLSKEVDLVDQCIKSYSAEKTIADQIEDEIKEMDQEIRRLMDSSSKDDKIKAKEIVNKRQKTLERFHIQREQEKVKV